MARERLTGASTTLPLPQPTSHCGARAPMVTAAAISDTGKDGRRDSLLLCCHRKDKRVSLSLKNETLPGIYLLNKDESSPLSAFSPLLVKLVSPPVSAPPPMLCIPIRSFCVYKMPRIK